jgi:predicted phage terminase large subunit-like protein
MSNSIDYQLILDEVEKRACEKSLAQFIKSSWHIIEPGRELIWNWHLDVICAYLEKISDGTLKRLIINIPPGTMKSSVVSVGYPAWKWVKDPEHKFLGITNEQGLALRDALKSKTIITSSWYQSKWPLLFARDQNEKILYQNEKRGFRQSLGIRAGILGKRGDTMLIDDPNDSNQVESDAHRLAVQEAYDLKLSTRLNDFEKSPIVLVAQRLHIGDLSGYLLQKIKIKWTKLTIPMEYEGVPSYDPVGDIGRDDLIDPRMEEGELLFPARFNEETISRLKEDLGSYGTSGQLQQRPSPRGGGIVKLSWFHRYKEPPRRQDNHVLRISLDTANKDKEINDPSVAGVWLTTDAGHYLLDIWRDKVVYPDLKHKVISLLEKWKPNECIIEDKASGQQLIQDLTRETFYNIIPIDPTGQGDKVVRMSNESPAIESGNCWLPEKATWLFDYESELEQFPRHTYKDQVDMTSQFLRRVRQPREIYIG